MQPLNEPTNQPKNQKKLFVNGKPCASMHRSGGDGTPGQTRQNCPKKRLDDQTTFRLKALDQPTF